MLILSRAGHVQARSIRRGKAVQQCAKSSAVASSHVDVCIDLLLSAEPSNLQAKSLADLIEKEVSKGKLVCAVPLLAIH